MSWKWNTNLSQKLVGTFSSIYQERKNNLGSVKMYVNDEGI